MSNDFDVRQFVCELANGVNAICAGDVNAYRDNVGFDLVGYPFGAYSVSSLADDPHTGAVVQQGFEAVAHNLVVIRQ